MPPAWVQRLRDSYEALGDALLAAEAESMRDSVVPKDDLHWSSQSLENLGPTSIVPQGSSGRWRRASHGTGMLALPGAIGEGVETSDVASDRVSTSTLDDVVPSRTPYSMVHLPDRAVSMLEIKGGLPQWDASGLLRMCEVSTGRRAVSVSRPAARESTSSWVMEFSCEEDKRRFSELMSGLRFGGREQRRVWTQDLTGHECKARAIPKSSNDSVDKVMKAIKSVIAFDGIFAVCGGMPARNFIAPRSPPWKVMLCYLPCILSVIAQVSSLVLYVIALKSVLAHPHSTHGQSPALLCACIAFLNCLGLAISWSGRHWLHMPFHDLPVLAVCKSSFNEETMPIILRHIWRSRAYLCTTYSVFAVIILLDAWYGGLFEHADHTMPGGSTILCIGTLLSVCSVLGMHLRFCTFSNCMHSLLKKFMEDLLMKDYPFAVFKGKFVQYWGFQERISTGSKFETVSLFIGYFSIGLWSVVLIWLGGDLLDEDSLDSQRILLAYLMGIFLSCLLSLYGINHVLWTSACLGGMFAETLCTFHRRHVFKPFSSETELDVTNFFASCDSSWTQATRPMCHVLGGVPISKRLLARLLYLYFYVTFGVLARLAAKAL